SQPVVRDPDRGAQPAEARRRGVEELTRRVEAAGKRRPDRRQRVEVAGDRVEERPPVVRQRVLEPGGGIERVGELEELGGIEPAAARRPLDGGPDVVRGADPDSWPLGQERTRLVRLVEAARDEDRVALGQERLGQTARRREGGLLRESVADE